MLLCCAIGIVYSLTAPSQALDSYSAAVQQMMPPVTPQMGQYSRIRYAIYFAWTALDVVFLFSLLQLGWAAKLRDFVTSKTTSLFLQVALYASLFSLLTAVVFSPFTYATGFWMKHHFGLSSQSLVDWLLDMAKYLGVGLAVEIPIWWLVYLALQRFESRWPYLVFAGSIPIILSLTFLEPIVIEPLFNKIELMSTSPLRTSIQALAADAGLKDAPIFTSDRTKQTNEINAYVTGLGASARIVLWDTTLKKLPPDQTLCVVAHELGHYALKHVYWGCAIAIGLSLLLLPVNLFVLPAMFGQLPTRWQVQSLQDFAGIPAIMLCATIIGFYGDPIINGYSRTVEAEADAYGYQLHKDGPAFARTFASLSRENLSEPNPPRWINFWLFSHPSLAERIQSVISRP